MKIFSNGCSFLGPRPKDGIETYTTKVIADAWQVPLVDSAAGGRGNDRICFTTKLFFAQHKDKFFAVIGWSSAERMDYVTNDGWKAGRFPWTKTTWRTWKVQEPTALRFVMKQKGYDIEMTSSKRIITHVLDLQNFFQLNKIEYVMYNSLKQDFGLKNPDMKILYDQIDKKRYFKIDYSQQEFIHENGYISSTNDPHPNTEGHTLWANQLMEFIDANNLRTK